MKRLFIISVLIALWQTSFAYDFYANAPSGQRLFYSYINGQNGDGVMLTAPRGIGDWWHGCELTGSLIIPDSVVNDGITYAVKALNSGALRGCYITSVSIPNTVTSIGSGAFQLCDSLRVVIIGDSVRNIESFTFNSCSRIKYLTLGASVSSIEGSAFTADSLIWVEIRNPIPPTIRNEVFHIGAIIYVPCSSYNAYRTALYWSHYNNLGTRDSGCLANVVAQPSNITMGSVVGSGTYYNGDTATLMAIPHSGYTFRGWNNGELSNPYNLITSGDTSVIAIFSDGHTSSTYDTTVVSYYQYDTTIVNIYDTTIINTYQYDTILVSVYDTVIRNYYQYDTTVINNYTYDTSIYNHFRYDTTLVYDTMIVNVYTYDTSIYNNYRFDTVILNTYQYDTTLVNIYDTIINNYYQYDTTIVYDTTIINIFDTTIVNNYQYDTVIVNNYVYDTVIINHYYNDTVTNYYHDTVNHYYHDTINNYYYDTIIITHYYHDTVIINNYIYDTIYLNRYFDTIFIHDTIYIHDTILGGDSGINNLEVINARIYQRNGQIVVEGASGERVSMYDVLGRLWATKQEDGDPIRLDTPASGTYLIKVGNYSARKVVVIR